MLTVYRCGHVYNEDAQYDYETHSDLLAILRGRQFHAPDVDCPKCAEKEAKKRRGLGYE